MESGSLILGDEGLEEILAFTIQLARNAGKIILEGSSAIREGVVNEKVNAVDLVTEWDVKVEKYVREKIANKYPGFQL
jgi:myo-inositol-1(or 4)-monophosphatase